MKLSNPKYEVMEVILASTGTLLIAFVGWLYLNQAVVHGSTIMVGTNRRAWTNKSSKPKSRMFIVYSGLTLNGLTLVNRWYVLLYLLY